MAAADYATIKVNITTTAKNVEKITPTDLRFPKADLITSLTSKMDADFADVTNASVDYESTQDDS